MNLIELAQRIKAERRKKNLTLEHVALRTGLTRSVLSKVENFRVTPSLPALAKIAQALGTTVSELTEGLDERPQLVIVRTGEGPRVERDRPESNIVYQSLAHDRYSKSMEPMLLDLPGGTTRKSALAHEGEEFMYVVAGQVQFDYGTETYMLNRGDSAYFDAQVEHRIDNPGTEPAQVLCVFGRGNGN
ncbi:MAG: helix-turn-helix transcriptional regulator [Pirellulales bacterium]|nr:helix-turn-helix transcriptional regulator [Pirellulales bacterium]